LGINVDALVIATFHQRRQERWLMLDEVLSCTPGWWTALFKSFSDASYGPLFLLYTTIRETMMESGRVTGRHDEFLPQQLGHDSSIKILVDTDT
jgi:hypothetical protein